MFFCKKNHKLTNVFIHKIFISQMDTLYEFDWYKAYPAYPLNFKKSIYMYCYAVVSTESSFKQFKTSRIYWGSFKCRWYKEKQYLFVSWPGSYCEEKLFHVASSSKLNSSEKRKTVLRAARWLWRQIQQREEHRRKHIKYCHVPILVSWVTTRIDFFLSS